MNQKDIKQLIIINLIILITFLIYIEYSVGNIFYRINHLGIKCLNLIACFLLFDRTIKK